MSMELTINTKKLQDAITAKSKKFFDTAKTLTARAGWEFVRIFSLKFLSGQIGNGEGLNRITSQLFKAFTSRTIGNFEGGDLATKVYFGPRGYYVKYHDASYSPKEEPRRNPVRIDVFGNFKSTGVKLYKHAVAESLKEFASV